MGNGHVHAVIAPQAGTFIHHAKLAWKNGFAHLRDQLLDGVLLFSLAKPRIVIESATRYRASARIPGVQAAPAQGLMSAFAERELQPAPSPALAQKPTIH